MPAKQKKPTLIDFASQELKRNYAVLRTQTVIGAIAAIVAMLVGLAVIAWGSVRLLSGAEVPATSLSIIAGIVTEFIAVVVFWFYRMHYSSLLGHSEANRLTVQEIFEWFADNFADLASLSSAAQESPRLTVQRRPPARRSWRIKK